MLSTEVAITDNDSLITDGYIGKQIKTIQHMIKDNFDVVIIIDGKEGCGKTYFGMQLCKMVDPSFNLDRVVFSSEEFADVVNKCSPGQAVLMDESMNSFFSRQAMSGTNIGGVKLLAMCRFRRLFLVLILPSFFELDRYPALHRSSALVHIYAMPKDEGKEGLTRGFFRWYDRKAKKRLYLLGKKGMEYQVSKPTFYGRFANKTVMDMNLYNEKKFKALQLIGGEDKPEPKLTLLYKKKYLKSIRYIHQNHNPPINRDDFIKWAKEKLDIDVTTKDLVMKSMNTEMGDDP
jgi:hypothetical protein